MRPYFLIGILFLSCGSVLATPKSAYFGIANESAPPFVEIDDSSGKAEIKGGLLKDLAEALLKELDMTPIMVLLPKKRLGSGLLSGSLSIVCYTHESWHPTIYKDLLWSHALTTNTNLIVSAKKKSVNKIEDLHGKQVGAIVNFAYKNLDHYFEKGLIHRDNAPDTESNIQKLVHGHLDYIILSNLEYDYYKKIYPQLTSYDLHLDTVTVKCAVSKKAGLDLSQLNHAIDTLKKNGTLDKVFKITASKSTQNNSK